MEIYTIERPSLLAALCAPTSAAWLSTRESFVVPTAERAQLSQAHQVRVQAELARTLVTVDGSYSKNGIDSVAKPMTDGASGVPPRGRPV